MERVVWGSSENVSVPALVFLSCEAIVAKEEASKMARGKRGSKGRGNVVHKRRRGFLFSP